jgi:uncharacterized protein YggE
MKTPFVVPLTLAIALAASAPGGAIALEEGASERTVSVTGAASVDYAPDTVVITLAVETFAVNAEDAASENALRAERVIEGLKERVGAGGVVETTAYDIQPEYHYDDIKGKAVFTGYRATNRVSVRTGKVAWAGALMDAAIRSGANRVDGVGFELSDRAGRCESVIARASEDARAKAAAAAKAFNLRLKGVKRLTPECGPEPRPWDAAAPEAKGMALTAATPVEPGSVTVRSTVGAVFYLGE